MRRRDDAHVDAAVPLTTHPLEAAVLQDAQQAHLRRQRQLTYFVEQQRTAVGPLEPSLTTLGRSRERPLLVAEELGVDQLGRNRAAVDAMEGTAGAPRRGVNGARDHFLARSGLAEQQDGRIRLGNLLDALHDGVRAHRRHPPRLALFRHQSRA